MNLRDNLLNLFKQVLNVKYTTIPESKASFAYERRDDVLYIFFEHSNGITDWKNNFDFPSKAYRDMENKWYVHRGFLRVWKSAKQYLKEQICNRGIRGIVVVGYSHGAALALLCHEFCVFNRPDIADNIFGFGYGCPRVVHGYLRRKICERFKHFYVIRNCRDIVTHVPPTLFGFRHVGNIVHIGKNANYGPIDSHRSENYLAQLEIAQKLPRQKQPQIQPIPCSRRYGTKIFCSLN